jgi:hypothetical protein
MDLLSKLLKSHFSIVTVLIDYYLIIQNKKSGTDISYLLTVGMLTTYKTIRIVYGFIDSFDSCIILLLSYL